MVTRVTIKTENPLRTTAGTLVQTTTPRGREFEKPYILYHTPPRKVNISEVDNNGQ